MLFKKLFNAVFFLLLACTTIAQSRHPFASIGEKAETVTLTNGKYDEFFDEDSIQRIGTVWVNINTMQVVKMQLSKQEEKLFDNGEGSRFLSVDPITSRFAMLTPYQYASNRPIDGIDMDGLEHFRYTLNLLKDGTTELKLKSKEDIKANTIDKFFGFKDNYAQDFSVDFQGKTYEFEGSTPNPFKNWNSDFEYFINKPDVAVKDHVVNTAEDYKIDWYVYSFQQSVMEQMSENMIFFGATEESITPKATVGFNTTQKNYREIFFEANPETVGEVVVHHAVEQQVETRYPGVFKNQELQSLENLRGISIKKNNELHLSIIRKAWNQFYKDNSNPTKESFLKYATSLDSKYGHLFNPQITKSSFYKPGAYSFSQSLIILMGLNTNSQSKDPKKIGQ